MALSLGAIIRQRICQANGLMLDRLMLIVGNAAFPHIQLVFFSGQHPQSGRID
jgi:hypothetical protein